MMEKIKKIRELTGAGVVDIKKALDEALGDESKAIQILRKKGLEKAGKKADRETKEGTIGVYLHSNGKIVSVVKIYCETDFVAKNEEFLSLAKDLAMQVAAMDPKAIRSEDISQKEVDEQKENWLEELKKENKPEELKQKIIRGKEDKFRKERALLSQAFVKNPEITVEDYVKEKIAKIGENIQVGEFFKTQL